MNPINPAVVEGNLGIGLTGESVLRAEIAEGEEEATSHSLSNR
jgi:hypothetical protein